MQETSLPEQLLSECAFSARNETENHHVLFFVFFCCGAVAGSRRDHVSIGPGLVFRPAGAGGLSGDAPRSRRPERRRADAGSADGSGTSLWSGAGLSRRYAGLPRLVQSDLPALSMTADGVNANEASCSPSPKGDGGHNLRSGRTAGMLRRMAPRK